MSSSEETLIRAVHRLLDQPTGETNEQLRAALLEGNVVDCLSRHSALALFRHAIEHASVELLSCLLRLRLHVGENNLTPTIMQCIVDEGDAQLLEIFLASEYVQLDECNHPVSDDARSILRAAVEQDNVELVCVLLRHAGLVQVDEQDPGTGWTALHYAAEWDSVPMQKLLLQKGADINARARDGLTPLLVAVHSGHFASTMFLIQSGADISVCDSSACTPLHMAAREGHTALVEYLLHSGADLHGRDAEGRTPLHVAAYHDESAARFARSDSDTQLTVIGALLAHGADINARDANGNSVLHTAQQGRFDVIVDLLLAHQRQRR